MNEKRLTEYDVQFVNRHYVRFGQFIESNVEPLAEGNRMEQRLNVNDLVQLICPI